MDGSQLTVKKTRSAKNGVKQVSELDTAASEVDDATIGGGDSHNVTDLLAENTELKLQLKRQSDELNEARADALHAMELKAQFMANISHELRTPLSGVLGMAELLKEMPLTNDQEELVSYIYVSAAGLVDVVNSLLDFSRLQSGKLRIENSEFSVKKTLEDIKKSYNEIAHRKGLELQIEVDDSLPDLVMGDELRIRQVLSGLVNNAIKFSDTGIIEISGRNVKTFDDMVVVRIDVKDSGIGIPVSEQNRVFMPFVQVDGSSTRKYGGVGLGLPICKLLVQLMSGSMSLSCAEGKGSIFSVSLPLEVKS